MKKKIRRAWLMVALVTMASTCLAQNYVEIREYGGSFIFATFTNVVETYWRAYDGVPTDHYVDTTVLEVKKVPAIFGILRTVPSVLVQDTGGSEGYVPNYLPLPDFSTFYRTVTTRQKFTVSGTNVAVLPASQFLEQDVTTAYKGNLPGELPRVLTWTEHLTRSYGTPDWSWRLGQNAGGYQSYLPRPSIVGAMKTSIEGDDIVTTQCTAFTILANTSGILEPQNSTSYLMCKIRGVTDAGYEAVLATRQIRWNASTEVVVDLSGPGQTRAYGIYPELWVRTYPPANPPPQTN